jgi:hypothetical protein
MGMAATVTMTIAAMTTTATMVTVATTATKSDQ